MLNHYLETAIKDLKNIQNLIDSDIEDIKQARHDALFERSKIKEHAIVTFENKKAFIDNEIVKLSQQNSGTQLEQLLSDKQQDLLDQLKQELLTLKEKNRYFAKLLLNVSEFYNSLYTRMLPTETDGYGPGKAKKTSLFELKA
ncbi:MAG: hypothetical protein ACQERK_00305 [Campylobacterota bacterium]